MLLDSMRGLAAVLLSVLCIPAVFTTTRSQPAGRVQQVEQGLSLPIQVNGGPRWTLEQRMKRLNVPGLGIAVVHNFQVDWAKGYGVRSAQTGEPVTETTRFQWASVTKPVTATVALRLVEAGMLDLDRNVNDYLKSWKVPESEFTREEKVTLRRLLSHTAGVTVAGFAGYGRGEEVPTILQCLDGIAPANNLPIRVDMKPGTRFRYSGGGYTIVQMLLEDVTGRPLADLARQYVFGPAGMTGASIGPATAAEELGRTSMAHIQKGVAEPGHRFLSGGSACCELWGTPTDLARFVVAIQRAFRGDAGAVLSKAMAATMLTPAPASTMGLGFEMNRGAAGTTFSHSGGNPGFSTLIVGLLPSGEGLVVAGNAGSGIAEDIRTSVARAYAWPGAQFASFASTAQMDRQVRVVREEANRAAVPTAITEGNLNRLGYALIEAGQIADAISVFRTTADVFPKSANACDSLAEAYEASGDAKAALVQYRLAIERLEKYPDSNRGYQRNREATLRKIQDLESRLAR